MELNMLPISQKEFEAVSKCAPNVRYQYFVKRIADVEELWSLKNQEGWVVMGDAEGQEYFPVWSHPIYADPCAINEWAGTVAEAISLDKWLNVWIPGMMRDGKSVVVFPTPKSPGCVPSLSQLKEDIEAELEKYE